MALRFDPSPFWEAYRRREAERPDFNTMVNQPLQMGLNTLLQFQQQKALQDQQNLENQRAQQVQEYQYGKDVPAGFNGLRGPTLDRQMTDALGAGPKPYFVPTQGQMGQSPLIAKFEAMRSARMNPPANTHIPGALERKEAYEREDMGLKREQLAEDRAYRRQIDQERLDLQRAGLGFREKQAETKEEIRTGKEDSLLKGQIQKADLIINKVDQALSKVSNFSAGWGSKLSGIPMTSAKNLEADIQTIKANLGFQQLQEMRASSPTGGALGQVSDREIGLLTSAVASLDQAQSPEQLVSRLQEIRDSYLRWKSAVNSSVGGFQSPSREVIVNSMEEINQLPMGTRFNFNGRKGTVQ